MISPATLQPVFGGIADVAAMSAWVQNLGQMRELEGYCLAGQSRFECAPAADLVQVSAVLSASPSMQAAPDRDKSSFFASLEIGLPPEQIFGGLLEALEYVTDRTDVEYGITMAQGSYNVYSGEEDSIQYPSFETLLLHTHGEGIALPSFKDLVDTWTEYQRDPAYSTFIYSRPTNSYQLPYLKPTGPDRISIWHWQDRFDTVRRQHVVATRAFQLLLETGHSFYPRLFVEELSPLDGGVIAQHCYSAENCAAVGDEQAFWQLVLS